MEDLWCSQRDARVALGSSVSVEETALVLRIPDFGNSAGLSHINRAYPSVSISNEEIVALPFRGGVIMIFVGAPVAQQDRAAAS